jgi:hypothetical protein
VDLEVVRAAGFQREKLKEDAVATFVIDQHVFDSYSGLSGGIYTT